jgi:hypothetical protein
MHVGFGTGDMGLPMPIGREDFRLDGRRHDAAFGTLDSPDLLRLLEL